jgi:hypothetical protein
MNCKFCQKETIYAPLHYGGRKFEVYYCFDCMTEYVHWANINNVHQYAMINDRMYRWSIELDGTLGRLWYVAEPGTPGKIPNKGLKLVKSFKQNYPTITPQNIQEKLRFILLFL